MKVLKVLGIALIAGSILFGETACSSMTQTGKGALIGGGGGAAVGAGLGALIGGRQRCRDWFGNRSSRRSRCGCPDWQQDGQAEARAAAAAWRPSQGRGDYRPERSEGHQGDLRRRHPLPDGQIYPQPPGPGRPYPLCRITQGEPQHQRANLRLYRQYGFVRGEPAPVGERADAVLSYLANSGVSPTRLSAQGIPMADYVASNETAAGRAQNRRVEIYITADKQMIEQAQAGTLK